MIDISFKCDCGTRVRGPIRAIGRTLPCPACHANVTVPKPSESDVRKAILAIPHALPSKKSADYLKLVDEIKRVTNLNIQLAKTASLDHVARECADEARRMLRNVVAFMADACDIPNDEAATDDTNVIPWLSRTAAGANFGGIGSSKANLEINRQWLHARPDTDTPVLALNSHQKYVFATITEIDSSIA